MTAAARRCLKRKPSPRLKIIDPRRSFAKRDGRLMGRRTRGRRSSCRRIISTTTTAVDYDGDGHRNLLRRQPGRRDRLDRELHIANGLKWRRGETLAAGSAGAAKPAVRFSLGSGPTSPSQLPRAKMGAVRRPPIRTDARPGPNDDLPASLLFTDGPDGTGVSSGLSQFRCLLPSGTTR